MLAGALSTTLRPGEVLNAWWPTVTVAKQEKLLQIHTVMCVQGEATMSILLKLLLLSRFSRVRFCAIP